MLKQLPYLLVLAEEKSISEAAKRLEISQSTLSKYLQRTEKELGYPLFFRNRNNLSLTFQGRIYIEAAQQIQSIYEETTANIKSILPNTSMLVDFAVMDPYLSHLLASILPDLQQKYPGLLVRIHTVHYQNITVALNAAPSTFLLLHFFADPEDSFRTLLLSKEPIYIASSVPLPCQSAEKEGSDETLQIIDPDSLSQIPHYQYLPGHPLYALANQFFRFLNLKPRQYLSCEDPFAILKNEKDLRGWCLIPSSRKQNCPGLWYYSLPADYQLELRLAFLSDPVLNSLAQTIADLIISRQKELL